MTFEEIKTMTIEEIKTIKNNFIAKNWDGENRWRRAELNKMATDMNLELFENDSNKDVFERILLEYIKMEEIEQLRELQEYRAEILKDPKILDLYNDFLAQLPDKKYITKHEMDYQFFVEHNIDHFFNQTSKSLKFLKYFLENEIYQVNDINDDNWITEESNCIFFHPNGSFAFLKINVAN